jgi:FKBP-type peptidyl-prolyl cis-trans isomerase
MHVSRRLALLCCLALIPACASDPTPVTDEQKALYEIGRQLSERLDFLEVTEEEIVFVAQGLEDGALGRQPQVDPTETTNLQTFVLRRRERRTNKEKEASASFIAAEAEEPGAVTFDSGLILRVTEEGSGPKPGAEDTVKVHYHGTLRDGTVFDSSVERRDPAVFPLNRVIPCWQEAIGQLSVGTKARVVCPSDIAYGDRGSPPRIQPGAALAFDVELLEIVEAPGE